MKCPECEKEGKHPCIYPGMGSTTLVYNQPFYDSDGNYHHHNTNTSTTQYTCSNGHEWSESTKGSCWCGWPDSGPYVNKEG